MTKILYSPGYGSDFGHGHPKEREIRTYQPLIDYVESQDGEASLDQDHPLLLQMVKDLELGPHFYLSLVTYLEVASVGEPSYVHEYDGFETVQLVRDLVVFE